MCRKNTAHTNMHTEPGT